MNETYPNRPACHNPCIAQKDGVREREEERAAESEKREREKQMEKREKGNNFDKMLL